MGARDGRPLLLAAIRLDGAPILAARSSYMPQLRD